MVANIFFFSPLPFDSSSSFLYHEDAAPSPKESATVSQDVPPPTLPLPNIPNVNHVDHILAVGPELPELGSPSPSFRPL
jgi:hypothetical protein